MEWITSIYSLYMTKTCASLGLSIFFLPVKFINGKEKTHHQPFSSAGCWAPLLMLGLSHHYPTFIRPQWHQKFGTVADKGVAQEGAINTFIRHVFKYQDGKFLAIYIGYCLWFWLFWDCHICQIRFDLFFQAGDAEEHPDRPFYRSCWFQKPSTNNGGTSKIHGFFHGESPCSLWKMTHSWGVPLISAPLDEAPRSICLRESRDSVSIPAASQVPSASQAAAAPVASKTPRRHMATENNTRGADEAWWFGNAATQRLENLDGNWWKVKETS